MRVWAVCGISASERALSWSLPYESMSGVQYECKCQGSFLDRCMGVWHVSVLLSSHADFQQYFSSIGLLSSRAPNQTLNIKRYEQYHISPVLDKAPGLRGPC